MQSSSVLCFGISAFLIVDLTFHGQLHIFRFRRVVNFLGLRATLVLPLVRVLRLKLQKQGATTVLQSCALISSYFVHLSFEHESLQQRQLCENHNIRTATRYQVARSKMVLDGHCAMQKREAANL